MKAKIFIVTEVIDNGGKCPLYYLKVKLFGQEFFLNEKMQITTKEKSFKTHKINLLKKYEPSN
jgi:hypothetical protein